MGGRQRPPAFVAPKKVDGGWGGKVAPLPKQPKRDRLCRGCAAAKRWRQAYAIGNTGAAGGAASQQQRQKVTGNASFLDRKAEAKRAHGTCQALKGKKISFRLIASHTHTWQPHSEI